MNKLPLKISAGFLVPVLFLTVALCMLPSMTRAQLVYPAGGFLYDDSDVPRIDITISPSDLENLYADPGSNEEYKVHFRFTRGETVEALDDVGIRFRGNTSRDKQKKAFKLSFNTFDRGREFHGIEEMNLNAETNDPSMVRSKLSWHLFRYLGVPGLRVNHVLFYINNDFYGVYINTEHIDEEFVKSRFNTNDGNLYKCLWPADLEYRGSGQDDYKFEIDGRRAYDLRINGEWDDYQDLADLINVLHHYSGARFMEEAEKVMNVQQYLKIMAVDVMTGNWDGYIPNKNNYYLYRDPVTGRFEYIAYDLDNTWGIDWLGQDWSDRPIYNWHMESRPLYEKILQQETYKQQYTGYIRILASYMTSPELVQEVERWKSQIAGWVSQDPYYSVDWGYTYADFDNALTTGRGGHIWYGVLEYASLRAASALEQCIQADAPPLVSHARVRPSPGKVLVDWTAEDDAGEVSTILHYRFGDGEWQAVSHPVPSETDTVSGIPSFRDSLTTVGDNSQLELYFTASDNNMQETRYPAGVLSISFPLASGPLRINEFMASNSTFYPDEYGEYDDWVEIYNPTDSLVWTGDLYLSDDAGDPGKFRFPSGYIYPGEFFVVWLDGEPGQGDKHASFKISKEGEQIRLSGRPAAGFPILDSLTFGLQATDVATGRSSDGGTDWIAFSQATPGFSNLSTGREGYLADQELIIYPNPVVGETMYFNRTVTGTIVDVTGKPVQRLENTRQVQVMSLSKGVFFFIPDEGKAVGFARIAD